MKVYEVIYGNSVFSVGIKWFKEAKFILLIYSVTLEGRHIMKSKNYFVIV